MHQIVQHLGDCEHCLLRLEMMPAGTLAEGLRRSLGLEAEEINSAESGSDINWSEFKPSNYQQLGFDRYELLGLLGESQLAICYLATNEKRLPFALKIPFVEKLNSPDHVNLFLRDATMAYSLTHQSIVKPADFGLWQERLPFVATPLLNVPSLKQIAKTSRFADEKILSHLYLQICTAIHYAHSQGVIHRHLTPHNIFLKPDLSVLVADFCLHYDGRYQFDLTQPLLDPDPFVSPESANNNPDFIDHRSDIFALGKILKLLLRLTDNREESSQVRWKKIHVKCTRPRRRDRYQSVEEILDAVKER